MESTMDASKNPFEAVRAMMIDTLEKSRSATQTYLDFVEKTMQGNPAVKQDQTSEYRAYIEAKVAANHAFVDQLLHAKDLPDAFRIQAEYLQSQLKATTEDITKLGAKIAGSFNRTQS